MCTTRRHFENNRICIDSYIFFGLESIHDATAWINSQSETHKYINAAKRPQISDEFCNKTATEIDRHSHVWKRAGSETRNSDYYAHFVDFDSNQYTNDEIVGFSRVLSKWPKRLVGQCEKCDVFGKTLVQFRWFNVWL